MEFLYSIKDERGSFPYCRSYIFTSTAKIGDRISSLEPIDLVNDRIPALYMAGSMELNENHLKVLDIVLKNRRFLPIIVLENDNYLQGKDRKKSYLPLVLRVSMLEAYIRKIYGNIGFLGVNWSHNKFGNLEMSEQLRILAKEVRAYTGYFNNSDSQNVSADKIFRNEMWFSRHDLILPTFPGPHTTDRVRV